MSETSIRRITERFLPEIPAACAEGRGEQFVHDFMRAMAIDLAETVFLAMEQAVTTAAPDDGAALWDWVQDYPYSRGLELIAAVTSTMEAFNSSAEQTKAAQMVSAVAYQGRLNELLEVAQPGGAA